MAVKATPEGYHTITPYIICEDAAKVRDFLKKAFDAQENMEPMKSPDGRIKHAELKIGNSMLMLSEACGETKATPIMLYLYVEDCDKAYDKAIKAGGVSVQEPKDQFYGDRSGGVKDPSGNQWWVATHKEDLSHEDLMKRMQEAMKEKAHA